MTKKVIIALYGAANRGKTTTLLKLIALLEGVQMVKKQDRRVVCEYRGKRIVVTTPGDDANVMSSNIQFMRESPWDIAVTATRTKGATVDMIKEYAKEVDAEIMWKDKLEISQEMQEEENIQCADCLLKEIDLILDKD